MSSSHAPRTMYPAGNCFYVAGAHVESRHGARIAGQMYVQHFPAPARAFPFPVVMVHGLGQSGNCYLGTPDGRPGWAAHFVASGFDVYVVDQVGHARSGTALEPAGYAEMDVARVQHLLGGDPYPQAGLHTQWPGIAKAPGDPAFDQMMAGQMAFLADPERHEALNFAAQAALLHRIGPAVYLTHSQSGPTGWKLADEYPELVKAVVAVEPNGPPYFDLVFTGGDPWYRYADRPARAYGLTRLPLRFDPPLAENETLPYVAGPAARDANLAHGFLQPAPARRLPRLACVPVAVVTAQASYRTPYDHCTVDFLRQAGVQAEHLRLEEHGISGNGHMMMLERNNAEIATLLAAWIQRNVPASGAPRGAGRP